jgi:hypothetical protein
MEETIEEMARTTGGRIIIVDDFSRRSLKAGNEPMIEVDLWFGAEDVANLVTELVPDAIVSTPRTIRSFVCAFQSADLVVATYDPSRDYGRIMIDIPAGGAEA